MLDVHQKTSRSFIHLVYKKFFLLPGRSSLKYATLDLCSVLSDHLYTFRDISVFYLNYVTHLTIEHHKSHCLEWYKYYLWRDKAQWQLQN